MKMDMSSADFAVTRENPVRTVSIGHSSGYLARLRTASGGDVHYVRRGSGPSFDGKGIVDIYSLSFPDGSRDKTMTIYIDPYCAEISRKAPEGLVLRMP